MNVWEQLWRIVESKCPACGSDDAYHGFNKVECPNPKCKNYDPKTKKGMPKDGIKLKARRDIDSFYPDMIKKGSPGRAVVKGGNISVELDKSVDPDDEFMVNVPYTDAFEETMGKDKVPEIFWEDWEEA